MTPQLLALLGSLALTAPGAAGSEAPVATPVPEQSEAHGLIRAKIKRSGGKVLEHPGLMLQEGEEVVLVLKKGDHVHEVTVFVERSENKYAFEVAYSHNGSLILEGKATAKAKEWIELASENGKTWVKLQIDPTKKRPDGIDLPDGNDPLDGIK